MVSLFSNRVFLVTVSALMLAGIGLASFWLYLSNTHVQVHSDPLPVTVEDKANALKSLQSASSDRVTASTTQEQPASSSEKADVLKSLQPTEAKTSNSSTTPTAPASSQVQDSEKAKLLQSLQSN